MTKNRKAKIRWAEKIRTESHSANERLACWMSFSWKFLAAVPSLCERARLTTTVRTSRCSTTS